MSLVAPAPPRCTNGSTPWTGRSPLDRIAPGEAHERDERAAGEDRPPPRPLRRAHRDRTVRRDRLREVLLLNALIGKDVARAACAAPPPPRRSPPCSATRATSAAGLARGRGRHRPRRRARRWRAANEACPRPVVPAAPTPALRRRAAGPAGPRLGRVRPPRYRRAHDRDGRRDRGAGHRPAEVRRRAAAPRVQCVPSPATTPSPCWC